MRNPVLVVGLVCVSACGTSAPVDPGMAGTWVGTMTVAITGASTQAYQNQNVNVAVSNQNATVSNVCPGGGGVVTATGSADSCAWSANFSCPATATTSCSSVVPTYTSGTIGCAMVMGAPVLTVVATGTAAGCGDAEPATLNFTGTAPMMP
jgi:hypothetical protein